MKPPNKLVIQYDKREKRRIRFPEQIEWKDHRGNAKLFEIEVEKAQLETFDYIIEGYSHITGIEKKGSWREIRQNTCTSDGRRFSRCLKRMSQCKYPYLLLTFDPLTPDPYAGLPWAAYDRLCRALHHNNIRLIMLPAQAPAEKKTAGRILIHTMWNHIWEHLHDQEHDEIKKLVGR